MLYLDKVSKYIYKDGSNQLISCSKVGSQGRPNRQDALPSPLPSLQEGSAGTEDTAAGTTQTATA